MDPVPGCIVSGRPTGAMRGHRMGAWRWRFPIMAAMLGVVAGCCSIHGTRSSDFALPTIRSDWDSAGVGDLRTQFAPVFCRHLGTERGDCEDWLEAPLAGTTTARRAPVPVVGRRTLVVIPGIFGECVAPWVTPFSADHAELARLGYDVLVVPVEGRASSERNARIIQEALTGRREPITHAVVVAYSKGVTDFMAAATRPEAAAWLPDVSVLVSIAGTANGSPLASRGEALYASLLSRLPWKHCPPSDGGGVASITYREAMPMARDFAHSNPAIATYSVAAITAADRVNPVLAPFHRLLNGMDRRNDGQVLVEDAIVPGSQVLGVFRADHWSIALPFAESDAREVAALGHRNAFPRGALIRALLEFTAPVAGSAPGAQPGRDVE